MASAAFSVRMDEDTKAQLDQIASDIGLSTSSAINVMAKRFVAERGFPFDVKSNAPTKIEHNSWVAERFNKSREIDLEAEKTPENAEFVEEIEKALVPMRMTLANAMLRDANEYLSYIKYYGMKPGIISYADDLDRQLEMMADDPVQSYLKSCEPETVRIIETVMYIGRECCDRMVPFSNCTDTIADWYDYLDMDLEKNHEANCDQVSGKGPLAEYLRHGMMLLGIRE